MAVTKREGACRYGARAAYKVSLHVYDEERVARGERRKLLLVGLIGWRAEQRLVLSEEG